MKLLEAIDEATNLGRTDSFPVFLEGKPVGRIYLVTSDDIEWLTQGKIDDAPDYVVYVNAIETNKLTEKNCKYYDLEDRDFDEKAEKEKLASSFGRAFGYFEKVTYSRFK